MMSQTISESISSKTQGAVQIRRGGSSLTSVTKLPLQRLRPAIGKYLKVLDIHLHRLHQHQCNMEKLVKMKNWTQLHAEQVNAASTVQQIKATLWELHLTRTRVVDNQVGDYHALVEDSVDKVTASHDMFRFIYQEEQPKPIITKTKPSTSTQGQMVTTSTCIVPDNSAAAASRDQLRQEMEELQAMVQLFIRTLTVTTETGESTLKENSEFTPARTVDNKTADMTKPLKMAMMPVVGALLGGAVAGPVGVFTGIEIGTLAGTVGGGVAGFVGSTILNSQDEGSSEVPDMNRNIESTTKDVRKSASQPSPTPHAPITQQSSVQQSSSISTSSSKRSAPQASPTQYLVDNRHDQPRTDSSDDNGNMSLLDRILFLGKGSD